MKCAGCPALCCRDVLYLTRREFETFHKKTPLIKYTQIGGVIILNPCPFLIENRCTIYAQRPLACIRYPLNVQYRDKTAVLLFHHKCPQVPKIPNGAQFISPSDLERMRISPEERSQMFVANLILDAEIGRAWKEFTLKERNKMRIFEAKIKQTVPGTMGILQIMPLNAYATLVQYVEDLLRKNPDKSYAQISKMVAALDVPY